MSNLAPNLLRLRRLLPGLFGAGIVVLVLMSAGAVHAGETWLHGSEQGETVSIWLTAVLGIGLTAFVFGTWRRRRAHGHEKRPAARRVPSESLSETSPFPVIELHRDGMVRYCNAAARAAFPDLQKQGLAHPLLRDVPGLMMDLEEQPAVVREVRVGSTFYERHLRAAPDGEHLRLYVLDVTERKRTEAALRRSEENFERAFRSAPMAICISRLADGRFVDVNDSFVRLLGYDDRTHLIGRRASEIGMWAEPGERLRMLKLLAQDDRAVHHWETKIQPISGERCHVYVSAVLMDFNGELCVLSTLHDVTARKQAEAGLAVLKAFYENTLKELPIEVSVLDAEARYIYLNPAALPDQTLLPWMSGKTAIDFAEKCGLDPEPYRRRHAWLLEVVRNKRIGQLEETLATPGGSTRHILRVATPVLDENGDVLYVVGYGVDITDRKEAELKLIEAKNAAEEMARLKGAFVANMSHEIRTPLTGIIGFATVLAEEVDGAQQELVELIRQSGERLLETLNSVLDLARIEANALELDLRPLDLVEELAAAARLFRPQAEQKGLRFKEDLPTRPVLVLLDRACVHRIANNLLSNAIKFTDEGEVRVELEYTGDEVHIHVRDTGVGIGTDFMPHLFQEFKQESTGLARSHNGSGLGLTITRGLVERMNGRIEVQSEKGKGSVFTVVFPAYSGGDGSASESSCATQRAEES